MAAFKGYFDDSQAFDATSNPIACAFAGYIGTVANWENFESKWQAALNKHGAPHFHMKELGKEGCDLHRLFGGKENEVTRNAFFTDLIGVIRECELEGFASVIRLPGLAQFNRDRAKNLLPMPLAIYTCYTAIYNEKKYRDASIIEVIVDRMPKAPSKLATAKQYASSHVWDDVSQNIQANALDGPASYKNVLPMQAADFAAYEVLKYNKDYEITYRQNEIGPPKRKSYELLLDAAKIKGIVWDHRQLCSLDDARLGVWTTEERKLWEPQFS
jgi:hypothetical protein